MPPAERLARLAGALDDLARRTGAALAWLTLAMVLATLVVVGARYGAGVGLIWLQEAVGWMHAAVFLLGAGYALAADEHVRVDIWYRRRGDRGRALVDLAGTLLLLLPFCAFLAWQSWPYVLASWRIGERSREAGGLPLLYLLKALIPLLALTLALAGIALALRAWATLRAPRRG